MDFIGFRPHQGIILFNYTATMVTYQKRRLTCFRPHQGIILFNANSQPADEVEEAVEVSVPIRGLFYLTI